MTSNFEGHWLTFNDAQKVDIVNFLVKEAYTKKVSILVEVELMEVFLVNIALQGLSYKDITIKTTLIESSVKLSNGSIVYFLPFLNSDVWKELGEVDYCFLYKTEMKVSDLCSLVSLCRRKYAKLFMLETLHEPSSFLFEFTKVSEK